MMKIFLNEPGVEALETLATRLSESSGNLNDIFLELKKSVNTEIDGTGIVKRFFEEETEQYYNIVSNIASTTEEIASHLRFVADKMREYILSKQEDVKYTINIDHEIRSAINHSVRKTTIPRTNGYWSVPTRPGNSMWILSPNSSMAEEINKTYHIKGILYHDNCPDFDRFVDANVGEVYLDSMPAYRKGKGGLMNWRI